MAYVDNVKRAATPKRITPQMMIDLSNAYVDQFLKVNKGLPTQFSDLIVAARKGDKAALRKVVETARKIVEAKNVTGTMGMFRRRRKKESLTKRFVKGARAFWDAVDLDAVYEETTEPLAYGKDLDEKFKRLRVAPGSVAPDSVPLWGAETGDLEPDEDDDGNPTGKKYDVVLEEDGSPACSNNVDPISLLPLTEDSVVRKAQGESKTCIGSEMLQELAKREGSNTLWPLTREELFKQPAEGTNFYSDFQRRLNRDDRDDRVLHEVQAWKCFNLSLACLAMTGAFGIAATVYMRDFNDALDNFHDTFNGGTHDEILDAAQVMATATSDMLTNSMGTIASAWAFRRTSSAAARQLSQANGDNVTVTGMAMERLRSMFQ